MNWDDYYFRSVPVDGTATIDTTIRQLVPRDDARLTLIISQPDVDIMTLYLNANGAFFGGILLTPGSGQLALDARHHGALVRGPVFAQLSSTSQLIGWWGCRAPCNCWGG